MDATGLSETLVLIYHITRCHIPEGSSSGKKIEATDYCEVLVPIYPFTQRHIPEGRDIDIHGRENLRYSLSHYLHTSTICTTLKKRLIHLRE
jgi:hypothetical protein